MEKINIGLHSSRQSENGKSDLYEILRALFSWMLTNRFWKFQVDPLVDQ